MKYAQKGQTLIESLVALAIMMTILTSIAVIVVNSLFNSQFIKEQNIANKYSEQGMEFMRSIQASNLTTFSTYTAGGPVTACINNSMTDLEPCPTIPGETFKRTVKLERGGVPGNICSTSETRVTVTTSWVSSKCSGSTYCHNSTVVSCLVHNKGITP